MLTFIVGTASIVTWVQYRGRSDRLPHSSLLQYCEYGEPRVTVPRAQRPDAEIHRCIVRDHGDRGVTVPRAQRPDATLNIEPLGLRVL
ncbi:MAG TPA: hypothetical protein VE135_09625 [Pyrinomonadaceae bacterium]|nr:hypothetical protein [Pyrinomonadaceae bacterium]